MKIPVKIGMAVVVVAMGAVIARDTWMGFAQILLGAVWLAALIYRLHESRDSK